MIQNLKPMTTNISKATGRLKESFIGKENKNKRLKKLINDGMGGCGKKK